MSNTSLFIGIVVASAPEFGLAVVVDTTKTANALGNEVLAIFPLSGSPFGAGEKWSPVPGEAVVCLYDPTTEQRAYIINKANDSLHDITEGNDGNRFYNIDKFTATDSEAQLEILTKLTEDTRKWFENRGNKTDRDQLPGDYIIDDNQGMAGLMVSRFLTQLRGSAISYIELSGIDHTITLVGDVIGSHTYITEKIDNYDFSVNNVAICESEAFGSKYGVAAFQETGSDGDIELKDKTALPLYRLQEISGGYVDGRERLIVGFPDDVATHTADTEPPVLSRQRESLTGALSNASVAQIMSVKTPWIPALHQKGYGMGVQSQYEDDEAAGPELRRPYDGSAGEPLEDPSKDASEDDKTLDAPINRLLDVLLSDDYVDKLLEKLNDKGLKLASKDKSILHKMSSSDKPKVPGGPISAQQYGIPSETTNIKDPVTGKSQLCYGTTSFITQEPNGDILLADGYGSEIRMSRGNIYISPALDLVFRPGRDMSAMAGRYASINAQDTITINSSKAMYVRANEDLKISGAMADGSKVKSSSFVVTLESGTDSGGPGGMVIKSDANLSITGQDLYIGRNAHTGKDEGTTTDPSSTGGIVIDAGENGALYTKCGESISKAQQHTLVTDSSVGASALVVGANMIGLYTECVICPAAMYMMPTENGVTVKVPDGTSETELSINTADQCHLLVYGTLVVNENAQINESCIICGTMAARVAAAAVPQLCGLRNAPEPYEFEFVDVGSSGDMVSAIVASYLSKKLYSDYYIATHSFFFPQYTLGYTPKMPAMLWQVWSQRSDIEPDGNTSQATWEEQYIQDPDGHDTAPYPGYDAWESGEITRIGYKVEKLKGGYPINVSK